MTAPIRPIDPAQRSTLGAMVTDQLREHVIHGRFEPGTVLAEVSLAAQFGVSRGPVREALQRLVQEGLLRREPRRGISVPRLATADLRDIYIAREAIESAAIAVVVAGDTSAITAELREVVRQMERAREADDWTLLAGLDLAFHRRIVEAALSPRLSRLYGTLIGETFAFLNMSAHHPRRDELVGQHRELVAGIAARDLPGLRRIVARHLGAGSSVQEPRREPPASTPQRAELARPRRPDRTRHRARRGTS